MHKATRVSTQLDHVRVYIYDVVAHAYALGCLLLHMLLHALVKVMVKVQVSWSKYKCDDILLQMLLQTLVKDYDAARRTLQDIEQHTETNVSHLQV